MQQTTNEFPDNHNPSQSARDRILAIRHQLIQHDEALEQMALNICDLQVLFAGLSEGQIKFVSENDQNLTGLQQSFNRLSRTVLDLLTTQTEILRRLDALEKSQAQAQPQDRGQIQIMPPARQWRIIGG